MGHLKLHDVSISYNGLAVVENLNMEIYDGQISSMLGPSGAGKTTILKAIAGLLPIQSGEISINDRVVTRVPAEKRDTVLIFQKPLLFPHLNVEQNVGFGLRMQKTDKSIALKKIETLIEITGLTGLEQRKIHQLSGGQQQRVALARGLVLEPSVLLLDEPLSNLDAQLRQQMRELIINVQEQTGTTMLFVTHDQGEALAISHRICLLLNGTLRQTGTPSELFYHPSDQDVARFFGSTNILRGAIKNGIFACHNISLPTHIKDTGDAKATIRPEDICTHDEPGTNTIGAEIISTRFEGSTTALEVQTPTSHFTVRCFRTGYRTGQLIHLSFPTNKIHIFP
ncbi:ABC transporter ATP-binding protein [Desulfopila sp. IMCC35008]|uniref:ABC transporter ATP-binding protein n=1 Tax=Desulfopila sp. IMCC35008 TaxID=2653858 RepID=UPI0013D54C31|nr:ABC transporter ATP-binding protein [Desulfopila sp. IMCC35008]